MKISMLNNALADVDATSRLLGAFVRFTQEPDHGAGNIDLLARMIDTYLVEDLPYETELDHHMLVFACANNLEDATNEMKYDIEGIGLYVPGLVRCYAKSGELHRFVEFLGFIHTHNKPFDEAAMAFFAPPKLTAVPKPTNKSQRKGKAAWSARGRSSR